ncbi:DUF4011 domain-containing protein [Rhodococcus hoagii]|nr:DUF4011 domain-containing protein [Prescottella equi]
MKTALRRLDVLSQQTYADKGVWTLYLGIGVLRWVDPADGAAVESPLLMCRFSSSGPEPTRLRAVSYGRRCLTQPGAETQDGRVRNRPSRRRS